MPDPLTSTSVQTLCLSEAPCEWPTRSKVPATTRTEIRILRMDVLLDGSAIGGRAVAGAHLSLCEAYQRVSQQKVWQHHNRPTRCRCEGSQRGRSKSRT